MSDPFKRNYVKIHVRLGVTFQMSSKTYTFCLNFAEFHTNCLRRVLLRSQYRKRLWESIQKSERKFPNTMLKTCQQMCGSYVLVFPERGGHDNQCLRQLHREKMQLLAFPLTMHGRRRGPRSAPFLCWMCRAVGSDKSISKMKRFVEATQTHSIVSPGKTQNISRTEIVLGYFLSTQSRLVAVF